MSAMDMPADRPIAKSAAQGKGAGHQLDLVGRPGDDDDQLGRQPARRADDGRLRAGLRLPLHRPGDRVPAADLAGLGRARVRLRGRHLQVGLAGHLQADGLPRRLVPVRDDDLLLPEPARLRRQHARLRDQPRAGLERGVDGPGHRGRLLDRRLGLLARYVGRRRPGQHGPDHRHPDPRRGAGHPRRRVPRPGQRVGRTDGRLPPAAGLGRSVQPRADRQQLPVLLGHGDERRARELAEEPGQGVPQGDVPGHGPGAADLHPPGAGDQLGGARPTSCRSPPA